MRHIVTLGFISWFPITCANVFGQESVVFVDVAAERGIRPYAMAPGMGGGVAAADYDDDGDIDFFVPNGSGRPDQLYRNDAGEFVEIAAQVGLASTDEHRCALWFDYDGDRALDLIVVNDIEGSPTAYRLYRQVAPDSFLDVTRSAGLYLPLSSRGSDLPIIHSGGLSVGDLNGDGYLDLVAPVWNGAGRVFLNNGDGTFRDATAETGFGAYIRTAHQSIIADFNGDHWMDIYVCIDFGPNLLFFNRGDGSFFENALAVGAANAMNDMGVTAGDVDNDGDLDLYITNIFGGYDKQVGWNVMLVNTGTSESPMFTDVAPRLGVDDGGWGWGTTFFDADNDGRLDIAATNGWVDRTDASRFFWNQGTSPLSFLDRSDEAAFNDLDWGSALVAFDYDRDGDLDLLQTCTDAPIRLLENRSSNPAVPIRNYLVVRPRWNATNHWAIGASVTVNFGGLTQSRFIQAGTSYLGQEPAEAHFGLGPADFVDSVVVTWPDGTTTTRNDIVPNRVLTIGCGDGLCDLFETHCTCDADCGLPTTSERGGDCFDGIDNDCDGALDCDDPDCCDDLNVCTYDECYSGWCRNAPTAYGDLDGGGTVNVFDLFCLLDGYAGSFTRCAKPRIDIASATKPCAPDGRIDAYDLLAVLDAFNAIDPCCRRRP